MEFTETKTFNNHSIACSIIDTGGKNIVIFCHGFRSSSIGPRRMFVTTARQLAAKRIGSLRFDQYGSGNSEGDFYNSSYNDWLETTTSIVKFYMDKGFRVALMGQSMGAATVIYVGSKVNDLVGIVAWVPDPNVDEVKMPPTGVIEEEGEIIQVKYWQEAHDAQIADKLKLVESPMYIVQCTNDQYVSEENHKAILDNAQPNHKVEMFEGYSHSSWTYQQSKLIIGKSVEFLTDCFFSNR